MGIYLSSKHKPPAEDDSSLGSLLLRMGEITQEMLSKALLVQTQIGNNKFLGEVLIELNMITKERLERALALQGKMRKSNGNDEWTESIIEASEDNVDSNMRQVRKLISFLKCVDDDYPY